MEKDLWSFHNPMKLYNPLKWIKKDGLWQTCDETSSFEKDETDTIRERMELCMWKVVWISYLVELKKQSIKSSISRNKNLNSLTDLLPGKSGYVKAVARILEPIKSQ
jgi:hypothetical protein